MSKIIKARAEGESLLYADRGTVHQIPIIAWNCECDLPAPITPIGVFYPGQRFAVRYGNFFIAMPDRSVTHSRPEIDALLSS